MSNQPVARVDRLVELAETIAAAWGARARLCTTVGQERANLRLLGVIGVDRAGRPLAGAAVDRYVAGRANRLAAGILLPFVAAMVEYDLSAQALALDVASGAVDLSLESEILNDPARRSVVEARAAALAASAFERIDANRTARLELLAVIGDAPRPWIGATTEEPDSADGAREAGAFVANGVDVVRVEVPASRELADRLHDAGFDLAPWRARGGSGPGEPDPAPSGSQRGLAEIRQAIDEAAAERRGYARLATAALPLAGPEQAVVAAFERVDIVDGDPIAEVVDGNVDPDRALADHAFAHRLIARSGSVVVIGAGPLVVAPDLARGAPSGPATLAGRALALQLLGAALARRDGIPANRVFVGAIPPWLIEERNSGALGIAQVLLRRAALPGQPLVFDEPETESTGVRWRAILGAALPLAEREGMIIRRTRSANAGRAVAETRAIVNVSADVAATYGPIDPRGIALEHARATVAAAIATLERLVADGWSSVLGSPLDRPGVPRLGADAVVERTESFDPFLIAGPAPDAH
jgi:D-Lysine 5,6-aminomutase TIM-barrel domain of alpha subunit